ncbi:MAG: hypothetical protein IBX55_21645 [Methyloprofundus sp.]|nr:hypothetical protein [Methyloprofundus sp.]
MKLTIVKTALVASFAMGLVACSTNPIEQQYKWEAEKQKIQAKQAKQSLDIAPDWFVKPMEADNTGFYATGTGHSKDLQHAVNKARLQAEFNLAKIYDQDISGSETAYTSEDAATGDYKSRSEVMVDKLVNRANITGYVVKNQQIMQESSGYRAYMLLHYPYAEFNRVKQEREKNNLTDGKSDMDSARDKLQQRLAN